MQFMYLGTAAAEGWPAFFCECDHCKRAQEKGEKNIRSRSGAMIDDRLLIDLNPDLFAQKLQFNLNLATINTILITHTHSDHLCKGHLEFLSNPFAHRKENTPIHICGSHDVLETLSEYSASPSLIFHTLTDGEQISINGYSILPLPAVHSAKNAQFFVIQKDNVSLLYAHDTGLFSDKAWAILHEHVHTPFDCVSMDCTNGPLIGAQYGGHMGFHENIVLKEMLLEKGLANRSTHFIANHFSHNGGMIYDEAIAYCTPYNIDISYDGMINHF